MKVKELIDRLTKVDRELEVFVDLSEDGLGIEPGEASDILALSRTDECVYENGYNRRSAPPLPEKFILIR